ncbi:MAG: glycogen/starch/alpha-glucan phosphorylase [Planctomycetota bacterium]
MASETTVRDVRVSIQLDPDSIVQSYARYLKCALAKDKYSATRYDRFLSFSRAVRESIMARWISTQQAYHRLNTKRVYYFSLEFLIGRSLLNNIINLGLDGPCREALKRLNLDWDEFLEVEVEAGLGNGGLGRLAACFLDSMATLGYPGVGYGLRYEYGIFRQTIVDGSQVEEPDNWLRLRYPWEVDRPEFAFPVSFGGWVESDPGAGPGRYRWVDTRVVTGMPYDIPVVGYGGKTVNNLRLWSARSGQEFDLDDFSKGDYAAAVEKKMSAENITKVLYPDDRVYAGRELRLCQQYFLVSCSLQDILRRHKNDKNPMAALPDKVAIQMNDTHPSLAVAELMRLLVDAEGLPWEEAWRITTATCAYTNHTLMPEALETWPVDMFERLLPRHLHIIYEINRRFLDDVSHRHPGDGARLERMSIVGEAPYKHIRMAHLATVGSHSVNGVSRIHSELLGKRLLPDFHHFFPKRFNNKTNGITPRRWLALCNPGLSRLITERIGDGWITDLDKLARLEPAIGEIAFRRRFREVKHNAKIAFADYIHRTVGATVDPASLFDIQVKRIHEYKRQLLNLLHVIVLYLRLRDKPDQEIVPRTFIFGGKAAPGYWMAKRIIRAIHAVGETLDGDPAVNGRLKVVFIPDYRVSLAEKIIPAADLSEQISTAGMEASGTSNMKFALNGALTIGTLDGANIEIMEAVGPENIFIFGLEASEVEDLLESGKNPGWEVYQKDHEIRRAVDLLFAGHFPGMDRECLERLRHTLLIQPDRFMHLADLKAYVKIQEKVSALYRRPDEWSRRALFNVVRMGRFSSDRTIREYAKKIWGIEPVKVTNV